MPAPKLTVISNQHANEVNSVDPWYTLLALDIPSNSLRPEAHIYVVHNDVDITYKVILYKAFQFDFPEFANKPGELPQFQVRLTNVNKMAHRLLEQYQGATGGTATFTVVSSVDLQGSSPAQKWLFEIKNSLAREDWATITLGGENPMRRQFPNIFFTADHCQWTYNSPIRRARLDHVGCVCAYQGSAPTCDKTLNGVDGCIAHGNQARFGAHPGIESQGFRTATIY